MSYYKPMAIQDYIGWATGVNRIIIDNTSITLGENALKTDELENGLKRSIKRGAFCPDIFQVKMRFNWVKDVIINGTNTHKNEYQLFTEWYKYYHKYGSVPFEFPKIIYSQDTGIMIYDTVENGPTNVECYKITSAIPGNKSGEDVEVDMTWQTVYGGEIQIEPSTPQINDCFANANYLDITFSSLGSTSPTSQMITVYSGDQNAQNTVVTKKGFYYDNANTMRVYYNTLPSGTVMTFAFNYPNYTVAKGTYIRSIP